MTDLKDELLECLNEKIFLLEGPPIIAADPSGKTSMEWADDGETNKGTVIRHLGKKGDGNLYSNEDEPEAVASGEAIASSAEEDELRQSNELQSEYDIEAYNRASSLGTQDTPGFLAQLGAMHQELGLEDSPRLEEQMETLIPIILEELTGYLVEEIIKEEYQTVLLEKAPAKLVMPSKPVERPDPNLDMPKMAEPISRMVPMNVTKDKKSKSNLFFNPDEYSTDGGFPTQQQVVNTSPPKPSANAFAGTDLQPFHQERSLYQKGADEQAQEIMDYNTHIANLKHKDPAGLDPGIAANVVADMGMGAVGSLAGAGLKGAAGALPALGSKIARGAKSAWQALAGRSSTRSVGTAMTKVKKAAETLARDVKTSYLPGMTPSDVASMVKTLPTAELKANAKHLAKQLSRSTANPQLKANMVTDFKDAVLPRSGVAAVDKIAGDIINKALKSRQWSKDAAWGAVPAAAATTYLLPKKWKGIEDDNQDSWFDAYTYKDASPGDQLRNFADSFEKEISSKLFKTLNRGGGIERIKSHLRSRGDFVDKHEEEMKKWKESDQKGKKPAGIGMPRDFLFQGVSDQDRAAVLKVWDDLQKNNPGFSEKTLTTFQPVGSDINRNVADAIQKDNEGEGRAVAAAEAAAASVDAEENVESTRDFSGYIKPNTRRERIRVSKLPVEDEDMDKKGNFIYRVVTDDGAVKRVQLPAQFYLPKKEFVEGSTDKREFKYGTVWTDPDGGYYLVKRKSTANKRAPATAAQSTQAAAVKPTALRMVGPTPNNANDGLLKATSRAEFKAHQKKYNIPPSHLTDAQRTHFRNLPKNTATGPVPQAKTSEAQKKYEDDWKKARTAAEFAQLLKNNPNLKVTTWMEKARKKAEQAEQTAARKESESE